ncbi:xanthine dehydrogenase [Bradyrhizobium sp.]|uniref:xanthine dehydrogenase n=1 Tax=Bradyrhizobium sp. TaxID=376 RepID=UPI004037BC4D
MNEPGQTSQRSASFRCAVILGTNEIASSVAVQLHRRGYGVVLSHDPHLPVIRRRMAFHDALFGDEIAIDGVIAERADSNLEIRTRFGRSGSVLITELGLLDLIPILKLDLLVDARMQKYLAKPDLRRLARSTIGLGPGFACGVNCDIAVETSPGKAGRIIQHGATEAANGLPSLLGGDSGQRFVRAQVDGRWHTAIEIGTRVFRDFVVGHLGNTPVRAPFDGILRGVVRDGMAVPAGAKLLEIDPRGRHASATRIDARVGTIGRAVVKALAVRERALPVQAGRTLHLVK